jgi:pimeloyl-ACP methyl ester carboxylesterase
MLLHGFPEFWYGWRNQIWPLVDAGFRVVMPDLRGYSDSDRPRATSTHRLDRVGDDVAQLIATLGERAVVVGHDRGGIIGWLLAADHPERVERLVIMNAPHPSRYLRSLLATRQALRSL